MNYRIILSRHIDSLLRNTDVHKKEIHRNFTKVLHNQLAQCRDILTSSTQISIALLHLNKTLEEEGWDLAEGIQNIMENDAVILKELTECHFIHITQSTSLRLMDLCHN